MTIKAFNSIQGFSVGQNPTQNIILANGDITTVNFTANGVSDLNDLSNVKIYGGLTGQTIITDGSGNLSFTTIGGNSAAVMPYFIPSDKSYIIPTDFQGLFSQPIEIEGSLEIDGVLVEVGTAVNAKSTQVLFDSEGEITGAVGFTYNLSSGNLQVPGNIISTGDVIPLGNSVSNLGSPSHLWHNLYLSGNTIYIGNSTISANATSLIFTNPIGGEFSVSGNSTSSTNSIVNGTSNIFVNHDDTIVFGSQGNANVVVIDGNGLYVTGNISSSDNILSVGNVSATGNIQGDAIIGNTLSITGVIHLGNIQGDSLSVSGNVTSGNASLGNLASANYFTASSGCVTIGTSTIQMTGSNAGIFNINASNINFGLAASDLTIGAVASNTTFRGNIYASGFSTSGNINAGNISGTLTTATQLNITSVGTLGNLSVTGNIAVTNTISSTSIKVGDLYTNRSSIPITNGTVIDSFATSDFRSAKYTIRTGCDIGYQAIEVLLVHDDINSLVTIYGSLSTAGVDLVVLETQIVSGNVQLIATALTANTNVNLMGTYVPD